MASSKTVRGVPPRSRSLGTADPGLAGASARRRTVARIVKSQGRRGEVAAEILTDFPARLLELQAVWLWDGLREAEQVQVENVWRHKNLVVFKLAGVDSIAAARALVGREVQVIPQSGTLLPAYTYFISDLIGCRVLDLASGIELGTVRELLETGGTDVLVVRNSAGHELLIPFAQEMCRRIAPEEKLIEVVLPEGLAELNP